MSRSERQNILYRHLSPGMKLSLTAAFFVLLAVSSSVFLDINRIGEPPHRTILAGLTL